MRFLVRLAALASILALAACQGGFFQLPPEDKADGGKKDAAKNPYDYQWWAPTGDAGDCSGCKESKSGKGGKAFEPSGNESEFVARDSNGALVVDMKSTKLTNNLWVADTNLPGVVKIDLDTLKITGRYMTGGSSTSRTTVNSLGEAFIGARANAKTGGTKTGVTKILPQGAKCVDTNKDGQITTSTSESALPYGQDDCVSWHVETDGDIRGLAAQDIPGLNHAEACKGFTGQTKEFDPKKVLSLDQHYIWVAGLHKKIYKIDAQSGKVMLKLTAPDKVYGMALAGDGKLWLGGPGSSGGLSFIDTLKCTNQAACEAAPVCKATCTTTTCPATCDTAVKAYYSGLPGGYGITVDYKKRVWRSGSPKGPAVRYDPYGPANARVAKSTVHTYGGGIGADAAGWVWASHLSGKYVARIHADNMSGTTIPVESKGIAVDIKGHVYSVEYAGKVHKIEPGASASSYKLTQNAVVLKGIAYAYSDMTGVQTRLASGEPGWYREVHSPCTAKEKTKFMFLTWDVDAPKGTWVMFNMRSADSAAALKTASWYTVACINPPGGKGKVKVDTFKGTHAEVEARFIATGDLNNPATINSAKINSFSLLYRCLGVN